MFSWERETEWEHKKVIILIIYVGSYESQGNFTEKVSLRISGGGRQDSSEGKGICHKP